MIRNDIRMIRNGIQMIRNDIRMIRNDICIIYFCEQVVNNRFANLLINNSRGRQSLAERLRCRLADNRESRKP
ncbi:MAG: hypothetical protein LBU34_05960 [Planctomycetaceae bacterium]|nr:hypothetical protein [Planctomycetaceae bacterium]